ncbi:sphingomyelin phosphodiesterase 4-like isoform X2 [Watersipora subatra]|uniref:sphingomyelin phosphodiesterase 4-like isoform X2 n=1 Tax=Watersipora subatra TaxID=2589382 RepID=UPI00355C5BF3
MKKMGSYVLNSTLIGKEPKDVFYDTYQSINRSQVAASTESMPVSTSSVSSGIPGAIGQALLKPTIYDKCQAMTAALSESVNIKELQHLYPTVLQKIFGFGSYLPGWQIETTHIGRSRRDSSALQAFLHPSGPIFTQLIHKLLAEEISFEFPYSCIPEPTRRKIEEGLPIAELYGNKLTLSVSQAQPMLILDAFEYFFFVFAHKMVSSSTKSQELYLEPSDWLYPSLLNDYLLYFLPMSGMPASLPLPKQRQGMGLLKQTSQFSRSISVQSGSDTSIDTDVMWRSERVVQVLAEMWLAQYSIDVPLQLKMSFSNSSNESLPSHDLIMLVRVFIKHIHAFVHSSDGNVIPSNQQNPTTILGALKRSLLARYIEKPLYGFLKHSIERWPLDTSFRPILETWLSFIRPWRYASSVNQSHPGAVEKDDDGPSVDKAHFVRNWGGFVRAHSLFYTCLFQEVIARFLRIDLTSSKMAYHLSRLCRVFSQEELVSILREVDLAAMPGMYAIHNRQDYSVTDVTAGVTGNAELELAKQISGLESASFNYRSMFSEEVTQQVQRLVQQAVDSQHIIQGRIKVTEHIQTSNQRNSLLSFLGLGEMVSFNEAMAGKPSQDLTSTNQWLGQSIFQLSAIYKIQVPEHCADVNGSGASNGSGTLPDHVIKSDGSLELTALGRYQVLNGLKRFTDIPTHCDPELQPIRSFESSIGVIQLYKLSCALNKKFGESLAHQYSRCGFAGCIARRLLVAPMKDGDGDAHPYNRYPRISLRLFANYVFIGYTLVGYLIMSTIIGPAPTILIGLLLFAAYIVGLSVLDMIKEQH